MFLVSILVILRELWGYRSGFAVRWERGYAVQQSESIIQGRVNVNEGQFSNGKRHTQKRSPANLHHPSDGWELQLLRE